jgi:hypothetical protein
MIQNLFQWLLLVVATEAVTELIVDAKVFDGWRLKIRQKAYPRIEEGQALPPPQKTWVFLAEAINCGYCTSVWVALGWGLFTPDIIHWGGGCFGLFSCWLINWLLSAVVLHRFSNWFHVLFSLVKKGRVKTYDIELKAQPISYTVEVSDGRVGSSNGEGEEKTRSQNHFEAGRSPLP